MAHAYTDHTQIIWNGVLGEISLRAHDDVFLKDIQVYLDIENKQIRVKGRMVNTGAEVEGQSFDKDYSASVDSVPVPVVTHEIGQYAVYPDLKEIDRYTIFEADCSSNTLSLVCSGATFKRPLTWRAISYSHTRWSVLK